MKNIIYILGPNKDENERFVGKNLSEQYAEHPEMFVLSTDKLAVDNDAICTYVIYNEDADWLYHYTNEKVVLVKDF